MPRFKLDPRKTRYTSRANAKYWGDRWKTKTGQDYRIVQTKRGFFKVLLKRKRNK